MTKFYLLLTALCIVTVPAYSQKELNIKDIEILNLGDGQRYVHERGDRDKAIDGKVRIITGITTEYIDAGIKKGYAEGTWNYYANNKLKESLSFKDGYMDGKQYLYFGSGDVEREASFKKGKKHGEWLHYSSSGGKREMEVFEEGYCIKRVTYYTNGNVDMERHFKNGKEDGVTKRYTQEGELKSEKTYANGKQIGKERSLITSNLGEFIRTCTYNEKGNMEGGYTEEWVESKKLKTKGQYVNGKKDGKWTEWHSNGNVRREETYKNGVKQDS